MIKVLLTDKNHVVNRKSRYNSSSIYTDTLAFKTYDERDSFINNELMIDREVSFKELLESQPKQGRSIQSPDSGKFIIDTKDYEPLTPNQLLNKNYLLVLIEELGIKTYKMYHIDSMVINNAVIECSASLDPFMTYTIDDIFTNQMLIKRAHVNQIIGNTFDFELPEIQLKEDIIDNLSFKGTETISLQQKDIEYEDFDIQEIVENTNFSILIYLTGEKAHEQGGLDFFGLRSFNESTPNPYNIFIQPKSNEWTFKIKNVDTITNWDNEIINHAVSANYGTPDSTISVAETKIIPKGRYEWDSVEQNYIVYIPNEEMGFNGIDIIPSSDHYDNIPVCYITKSTQQINYEEIDYFVELENYSKNNKRSMDFELKLLTDGTSYSLFDSKSSVILDSALMKGTLNMEMDISIEPANTNINVFTKSGEYQISQNDLTQLNTLADIELPFGITAWNDYISNFRATSKTGLLSPILTIAGGYAGDKASILSLGLQQEINQISKRIDIHNRPSTLKKGSGGMITQLTGNKEFGLVKNEFIPNDKELYYDFLYKNGWKINKIKDIKDYIFTRNYFNFLQTEPCVENISTNLPDSIRETISDSLSSETGLRLWYYSENYKGIKNYEYENTQTNIDNGN